MYIIPKQYGSFAYRNNRRLIFNDSKGGDMSEWSEEMRVREMPRGVAIEADAMEISKAGRRKT